MTTLINRKWTLAKRPTDGPIGNDLFNWIEEPVSNLREGEFLVKNSMLSFDPSQRLWMQRDTYIPKIEIGAVMQSFGTGTVIKSRNTRFAEGTKVTGLFGWQDFALVHEHRSNPIFSLPSGIPDDAALSIFGMTGMTGFFGMDDVGKPQKDDIVLVSGASGATGSVAAQVAKLRGAHVIGIAGSEQKCRWLIEKAHIDGVINYKTQDISSRLKELAPAGINLYFDNVGGQTLDIALSHLSMKARVVLCGSISTYDGSSPGAIKNYSNLILKRACMQGFLVFDYAPRFMEGVAVLASWLADKKICYEVDVQTGLENAPKTLQRLFEGKNLGKQLLRLS
jgi:NADPH-dependent curcumin reductase CurA